MVLWRISNHCDLSGAGAQRFSARWHTAARGKPVVYLAEHPALALIETLVNLRARPDTLLDKYQLMKVASRSVSSTIVEGSSLPDGWRSYWPATQVIGDEWLASGSTALLAVPSAPSPESTNYLLNPLHPDARHIQIDWCRSIGYDNRLFGIRERK
jgi:RES domain-containing protein